MALLTRTEELLLLSVWRLQSDAYGLAVRRHMAELLSRNLSVGAIYIPLERLVKKGFLHTRESSPTDKRGGRRKRFYNLSGKGMAALNAVRDVQQKAWSGLPELAFA
ncbi:MAG: helix-turn-helix transcriptional regulator [Bacteroidetes bacterium]|nr:helix-turn-helix transcriptional regulator [Bacteroidota bacterium]MCZ6756906.1 helix-turn-helix transcriptional regulator [Bacteroidota bacterium]